MTIDQPETARHSQVGLGNRSYYQQYYSGRAPEHYLWLLNDVLRYGRPGKILDLGCGTGLFTELAWKWGLNVQGLDGSADAVAMAKARNSSLPVQLCALDRQIPLPSCSFDNVVLNEVIEHLPAHSQTSLLGECARLVVPGGTIFVLSPGKANHEEVARDPTHVNALYPSELHRLLSALDLEIIVEPNSSRVRLRILSRLVSVLMRTSLRDYLSATANAYARKRASK